MAYIGKRLREIRDARDLTQDELGERVGMKRTDISKAENDKLSIGPVRLARLVQALDVSVLELAPESEPDAKGLVLEDRQAALEADVLRLAGEVATLIGQVEHLDDQLERLADRVELLERRVPPGSQGEARSSRT